VARDHAALATHYTVIAPDLPGAGDAPPAGYDKKSMAGGLCGLLVAATRCTLEADEATPSQRPPAAGRPA
jgi:pimeloyl-ACP methyl ester carboxylesterase